MPSFNQATTSPTRTEIAAVLAPPAVHEQGTQVNNANGYTKIPEYARVGTGAAFPTTGQRWPMGAR